MKVINSFCFVLIFVFTPIKISAQEEIFGIDEYLALIKKHHPVIKQANLKLSQAEEKLLKARGLFDPKLGGKHKQKDFKGTGYYDLWQGEIKIPTWFGIELQSQYNLAEGYYVNRQNITPEEGLWSVGVSLPLAKDLLYDDRRNALKQAKIFQDSERIQRDIKTNEILTKALKAYSYWILYYENKQVYKTFLENAIIRNQGVVKKALAGDIPTIDTLETHLFVKKQELAFNEAKLQEQKAKLAVSNFLWVENVPLAITDELVPDSNIIMAQLVPNLIGLDNFQVNQHPQVQLLENDLTAQDYNLRLKRNNLLPDLRINYNFLTEQWSDRSVFNENDYTFGVAFQFPLFLRKERADVRIAKYEIEKLNYEKSALAYRLENDIKAQQVLINTQINQLEILEEIVDGSQKLVKAEQRLFALGESSIFLINSRDNKFIENRIKLNKVKNKLNLAYAELISLLQPKID
jgi:outer membrane protein TolC